LDPTLSQAGDICLPFFWYKNALSIPDGEFDKMGEMVIQQINFLKHANGALDTVDVSVFAWAEDVHLSIPTSTDMDGLVPQSGDEYGSGIVSKPMAVLAKTAGMLKNFPPISAYAKAVEMAAGSMGHIATLFGYSRPNVVSDIQLFKPLFLGNMANTRGADTAIKLTLDPKQELTVDPRTMGLGSHDEMTILSIAQRESYLTQFPWTIGDQPEFPLWTSKVSPVLWDVNNLGPTTEYHFPACCFATLPFLKWRGSLKFRFQVVCSNFHKGRLKVVYDPYAFSSNEYNTNFTHIVDISKDKDFTVEVGWGHNTAYCQHENPITADVPFKKDGAFQPSTSLDLTNGALSVYVVNQLVVPNLEFNNDITINVYVSAGDDFEVAEPTSVFIDSMSIFNDPTAGQAIAGEPEEDLEPIEEDFVNQSGVEELANEDENKPQMQEPVNIMAPTLDDTDRTQEVFYGDPITSFRQMLKRYNFYTSDHFTQAGSYITASKRPNFPLHRGYSPTGVNQTGAGDNFNYVHMTLLNYIAPAYGAWRGGIRWKVIAAHFANNYGLSMVKREPGNNTNSYQNYQLAIGNGTGTADQLKRFRMLNSVTSGLEGMLATPLPNNPVLEYEVPFYDNVRFYPAKHVSNFDGYPYTQSHTYYDYSFATAANTKAHFYYNAVGEDFTLSFYLGPPIYYAYSLPSTQ
jgi:hypothetical protein